MQVAIRISQQTVKGSKMSSMITWSNQKQQGSMRSVDAAYQGTEQLESFDLSLMFPPSAVQSISLSQEASGWTIFSNKTDDGRYLIAGILNPGQSYKSGQKLFTMDLGVSAESKNNLSFLYSGNLNAIDLKPSAFEFNGFTETVSKTDLVPLQSSKLSAGSVNAWLDKADGLITSLSDKVSATLDTAHFEQLVTPVDLKITVNQAASEATMRLYVDNDHMEKGFWVRSTTGEWLNLVSNVQGGAAFNGDTEIPQAVFQFNIQDGGTMDADGLANGLVSLVGVIGHIDLNLLGRTSDLPQGNLWL
jgi:hypothetical protein